MREQHDREVEDDNYMPPSEDEASLDDDEFVVPEDPVEQEHFQRRLMAMARSLKKKSNYSQIIFMFKIRGVLSMLEDLNI